MNTPTTDTHASLAILGPGRLGSALATLARQAGIPDVFVGARTPREDQLSLTDAASRADLVLLTVSDDAIESVCTALAESGAFRPGAIIAHCSGVHGSDLLAAAKAAGCHIASFHPLQTFPSAESALQRFAGTYCFCEGDDDATCALAALARALGGIPTIFPTGGKALYHAAAVMASNYVTALADAAIDTAAQAGIDPATAQAALGILLTTAAANAIELGPAEALTGPIARGDLGTVKKHLAALVDCEENLRLLYCAAGLRTVELAMRKGTLDPNSADELRQCLKNTT